MGTSLPSPEIIGFNLAAVRAVRGKGGGILRSELAQGDPRRAGHGAGDAGDSGYDRPVPAKRRGDHVVDKGTERGGGGGRSPDARRSGRSCTNRDRWARPTMMRRGIALFRPFRMSKSIPPGRGLFWRSFRFSLAAGRRDPACGGAGGGGSACGDEARSGGGGGAPVGDHCLRRAKGERGLVVGALKKIVESYRSGAR